MIKSIRYFLLISLLLSITIASAINGIGNYLLDEKVIQPYLDSELIRISSLISLLNRTTSASNAKVKADIIDYLHNNQAITQHKFLFQIWNKNGKLLIHSLDEFPISFKDVTLGFSDQVIEGNSWRIYSTYD